MVCSCLFSGKYKILLDEFPEDEVLLKVLAFGNVRPVVVGEIVSDRSRSTVIVLLATQGRDVGFHGRWCYMPVVKL